MAILCGLSLAFTAAPRAWADEGDGDRSTAQEKPDDKQKQAAKTPSKSRVESAKELVASLEKLLSDLEKAGKLDDAARKRLTQAIAAARKLTEPIAAKDLTEDERKQLEGEFADERGENSRSRWTRYKERLIAKALEGAGLTEEESARASEIVGNWYAKSMAARFKGESKQVSDLKRKRDKDLKALLGRRKAQRVIHNLAKLSGPGSGAGGGPGYGPSRPR